MEPTDDDAPGRSDPTDVPEGTAALSRASIGYGIALGMVAGVLIGAVVSAVGLWLVIGAVVGGGLGAVVDVESWFKRSRSK